MRRAAPMEGGAIYATGRGRAGRNDTDCSGPHGLCDDMTAGGQGVPLDFPRPPAPQPPHRTLLVTHHLQKLGLRLGTAWGSAVGWVARGRHYSNHVCVRAWAHAEIVRWRWVCGRGGGGGRGRGGARLGPAGTPKVRAAPRHVLRGLRRRVVLHLLVPPPTRAQHYQKSVPRDPR
jgi:hypothetical protein